MALDPRYPDLVYHFYVDGDRSVDHLGRPGIQKTGYSGLGGSSQVLASTKKDSDARGRGDRIRGGMDRC